MALTHDPLDPGRLIGRVTRVEARSFHVSATEFPWRDPPSIGTHVVAQAGTTVALARVTDVWLTERESGAMRRAVSETRDLDAAPTLRAHILGSMLLGCDRVSTSVNHPHVGGRVFLAHPDVVQAFLAGAMRSLRSEGPEIELGSHEGVPVALPTPVLLGRHCAVVGATGGGKSWTLATIAEQLIKQDCCQVLLVDASGEFAGLFPGERHVTFDSRDKNADHVRYPHYCLSTGDLLAVFKPAGMSQAPKLREAIRSLRLAEIDSALATDGLVRKAGQIRTAYDEALRQHADSLDAEGARFDATLLAQQISEECVFATPQQGATNRWGGVNNNEVSYCTTLVLRVEQAVVSAALRCVFGDAPHTIPEVIQEWMNGGHRMLRIDVSSLSSEHDAREVVANAIARHLLRFAQEHDVARPVVILLDEAHRFLGRQIGIEGSMWPMDAFELIAKEGRKLGLHLCLATQRPADLSHDVLSQIGAVVSHRLTHSQDIANVHRIASEDESLVSSLLATLREGEALVAGSGIPLAFKCRVREPENRPSSQGVRFGL